MLQPVPTNVPDPKDAVLWSLFDRLQKIDENQGSRTAFATGIVYNSHFGLSSGVFETELKDIRTVLKIPDPTPDMDTSKGTSREFDAGTVLTMRDDL